MTSTRTALVCGAGGFIGGHLVKRLKREGFWVRGVDIKRHEFPERWRPWGDKTAVVVADGYPCRPCDHKNCVNPNDNCMDAIQVDDVLQAFQKLVVDQE
jgi:NAD(P)-dependent dehydrogenase (short-subunit alcohol dehydrogenase family)